MSKYRNAEGARLGATSIRQDSEKVDLYLLDGLTYDLDSLAPATRHIEMWKRPLSDVQTAPTGCRFVNVATGRGGFSRRSMCIYR